jgi:hypothetical protein
MRRATERIAVAILAKAPVPGFAKTRLVPLLGPEGAAALQARMIARAVETACAAALGPVVLWAAPDPEHACFRRLARDFPIALARQPDADLGARMLAAFTAANGPAIVIGTDCPALTPAHLRAAAARLAAGAPAAIVPAEDGGYALIGLRAPVPDIFADMPWGGADVMAETRARLGRLGLALAEFAPLWDVDRPEDIARLRACGLEGLLPAPSTAV